MAQPVQNDPVYCRYESPTQTKQIAQLQVQSGEIWGSGKGPPNTNNVPSVKAYVGPLPPNQRGIEFTTPIPPDRKSSSPKEARWYHPQTPGVILNRQGYAVIPANVLKIEYA